MKRMILAVLCLTLAACAAPFYDDNQYTSDGRKVCGPKESIHSGCVYIIERNCIGTATSERAEMKSCGKML